MNHPEKVTEEYLICPRCFGNRSLKAPTTQLACGHVLCLRCAADDQLKDPQDCRKILCPVCCLPTALPFGKTTNLPRSIFKERQLDHLLRRNNAALGRNDAIYCIEQFCTDPKNFNAQF